MTKRDIRFSQCNFEWARLTLKMADPSRISNNISNDFFLNRVTVLCWSECIAAVSASTVRVTSCSQPRNCFDNISAQGKMIHSLMDVIYSEIHLSALSILMSLLINCIFQSMAYTIPGNQLPCQRLTTDCLSIWIIWWVRQANVLNVA